MSTDEDVRKNEKTLLGIALEKGKMRVAKFWKVVTDPQNTGNISIQPRNATLRYVLERMKTQVYT